MDLLRTWTPERLALAIVTYWFLLATAWRLYARRPGLAARQAKAREAAHVEEHAGDRPGERVVTYSTTVNLTPVLAIALLPPAALVAVWLLA